MRARLSIFCALDCALAAVLLADGHLVPPLNHDAASFTDALTVRSRQLLICCFLSAPLSLMLISAGLRLFGAVPCREEAQLPAPLWSAPVRVWRGEASAEAGRERSHLAL